MNYQDIIDKLEQTYTRATDRATVNAKKQQFRIANTWEDKASGIRIAIRSITQLHNETQS